MTAELEHLTYGWLVIGPRKTRVQILGRVKTLIRIRALERTRLAGRDRWLAPGEETSVVRHVLELEGGREPGPHDIGRWQR